MSKVESKDTKGKGPPKIESIPFKKFFTYITPCQRALLIIGTISAVLAGILIPAIGIVMGYVTDTFDPNSSKEDTLNN